MLNIIKTIASNGVISNNGTLPWMIPEINNDILEIIEGKEVILGYNTFNFMGSKPFPRASKTYVISRKVKTPRIKDVSFIKTTNRIPHMGKKDIFVLGGITCFNSFESLINNKKICYIIQQSYEGEVTDLVNLTAHFDIKDMMKGHDVTTGYKEVEIMKCIKNF